MNKKITKLLSVFVIAGLIGAGAAFSATGCKNKPNQDQEQNLPGDDQNPKTEYTVTFDANGHGKVPAAATTVEGKVTKPADLTAIGYVFGGWYTDAACTTPFDFTAAVTANTTVYAKWTDEVIDLTPDEQGVVNISTPAAFIAFRQLSELPGTTYKLTADIDLDGAVLAAPKAVIGEGKTFDGQGYTIKNAYYPEASSKTGILCASVNSGTVTNIKFLSCAISSSNESAGIVAGLAEGTSTFTKLEFNSCSASSGNNYVGLIFARNGSKEANITIEEITAKNGCLTSCAQYGGLLMGDMTGTSTVSFKNLDVAGEFAGSSGNGSFIAGRTRTGATVSVENAVISATMPEANSIGIFSGNGSATKLTVKNILILKSNKTNLYQVSKLPKEKEITDVYTVEGVTVNIDDKEKDEAGNETPVSTPLPSTGANTPAYLKDTLGFDFTADTGIWMTEGENDAKYRLRASSTNVKSADATLSEVKVSTNNVKTRFKKGEEFVSSGLGVMGAYSDGVQLVLNPTEGYTIDSTSFNKDTVGEYTITVKAVEDATKTTTYKVTVVEETGFEVVDEHMDHVYLVGDKLDTDNLVVKSIWSDGIKEKLNAKEYTIDAPSYDMNTAGAYEVSIKHGTYDAKTVKINVLSSIPQPVDGKVYVNVSAAHTGANGELVNGVETFKSVKDAINFYETIGYEQDVVKVINVGEGTYKDKITTDLANLVLIGEGTDKSVLTYSAVESTIDPVSMKAYGLKCATLHVKGEGFRAYNLAIRNDFDYINDNKKEASPQGLALTIEGDQAVVENCYLYGNQDTLYFKKGRTYLKNTQIDGNIDFIFGEANGLAYFENCTIKAITKFTDDASNKTNNGYVTAMKADSTNKPDYGYIFKGCTFTDDGKLIEGSMSLGRPWGPKATVAYIECSFTKAYSKVAYDGTAKSRWFDMSGNSPAGADFCEYGSTGEGAITEAVEGGKVLTADQAANYTKENIFAATNGLCTWTAAWDCDAASAALATLVGETVDPTEIYVSETTVSLEVGTEEKLCITTAPWNANDKALTITVEDPTVATWSNGVLKALKAGETTITVEKDGLTSKTIAVTVTEPVSGATKTDNNVYSYEAITPKANDKDPLVQADLTGANAFLTIAEEGAVTYRISSKCIENKGAGLTVTFKGTGTITITYCSTSAKNISRLGLLDAEGKYVVASTVGEGATLVTDTTKNENGSYSMGNGVEGGTGGTDVTLTFTVTKAGTYTITCPYGVTGRGARIKAITMVDTYAG